MRKGKNMPKNIAEYVREAKKGEQQAFSKLFELTNKSAYYTALKITKHQDDAEDIVQDAYIKAFTSLDKLADDSKFESWFNCIVANKCRDLLKKKKPDLFSEYETDDSDIAFEDTLENRDLLLLPESVTENEALRKLIMDCIERLPDEQRACVVMFYYDELSVKEIADALKIPEGTVKSRLSKARKTLRKEFENIEEKDKIKLHAVPFFPLLRWAFQNGSQSDSSSKVAFARIWKAISKALSKKGIIAVSSINSAIAVKIIAGTVAAAIAVTGLVFGVKAYNENHNPPSDQPVNAVTSATVSDEDDNEFYYDESPVAVTSKDEKFIYYISDDGIIQKSTDSKTKIIVNRVPDNLVFTDSLMYISDGVLYSYDGNNEHELQKTDGSMLYEADSTLISISSDKKDAYKIKRDEKTASRLDITGNNMKLLNGYIYYYDSGDNLCRTHFNSEEKEIVISSDYTKGFRAAYCIQGDTVYFAGFNSDSDGTIYSSQLGSGNVSEINLNNDGIRDFTVIDNDIYYSTYKGEFYRTALNGDSKLIAEKNYYNICNSNGYTLWADMDTNEVFIIKSGSSNMQKTNLPNTIIEFEKLGDTAYYRTNEGHNVYALGMESD